MTIGGAFRPSPEQALIVGAPLESLRVSAGAGTGKTATVAARVATLVADHGLDPDSVIGLTFTNKAAEELADRIHRHLEGDPDRAVEVVTYHGFAAMLLREHGLFVGVERGTRLLTPAYARQVVANVLAGAGLERFDPTLPSAIDDVLRLAAETSEHLLAVAEVPTGDGDVAATRAEILSVAAAYDREKRRLGMIDYGDLVARAHELVTTHPEVAESVRRRYRAVVLDEYQDTSPAQRELLRALFAGTVPVMAVGDADQTIYEWRGASTENFEAFPDHFPNGSRPAPTRILSLNRRSGRAVLAVANDVRARIDGVPRPTLTPLDEAPLGRVVAHWDDTAAGEADWIAGNLQRLHDEGRAWRDMAVLFRKNKDMPVVHQALARHDIPFEVANLGGLLSVPEIVDLVSWLRVVHHPHDGAALARVLLGSRFRLGLGDLAVLSRAARRPDLSEEDEPVSLVEAVDDLDGLALRPGAVAALARFRDEHRLLLERAQAASVSDLSRSILDLTGAWSDVDAMESTAALTARLNLYRFLDLTEEWSPLEGRPSLGAFLAHLATLESETIDAPDAARLSGSDAVVLLTVHRAKGLEWPVVFLPAVYEGNFPASGGIPDPLRVAKALPFELRLDRGTLPGADLGSTERKAALDDRAHRQEWRIAYVATTRPREELYVSGAWWYGHPEPRKTPTRPSDLFALVTSHAEPLDMPSVPPPRPLPASIPVAPPPDPLFPGSWPAALRLALADPGWPTRMADDLDLAEVFAATVEAHHATLFALPGRSEAPPESMSEAAVTDLVTYASCPKRYYWSAVDRLPRRGSSAARRGVDVHRRIELHSLGVTPLGEIDVDTDGDAPGGSASGPGPFTVYLTSRFASEPPLLVEAPFELTVGSLGVRGRVDAVYGDAAAWEIVDFKSGSPSADPARIVQLEVYALAAAGGALAPRPPAALAATFAYLGGGVLTEQSHLADESWLGRARGHIEEIAAGINDARWDPRPSPACGNCDFLRFCAEGRESGVTPPDRRGRR